MSKEEQENCPHNLKYRTFALVAGRSYTNCTKCDKSWETTNFINTFNKEIVPTAKFTVNENMVPIFDDIENMKKNMRSED